jgi:hypothetical protein
MVTEAFKGTLRANRNRLSNACVEECLTARPTSRADGKPGASDPVVERGIAIAQRIKVTPGITGLSDPRAHIDDPVWHLDWEGFGCSPIKAVRELGSVRRETVRSLSTVGAGHLRMTRL